MNKIRVCRTSSFIRFLGGILALSMMIPVFAAAGWYNNFDQAVQVARQQGRPLLVNFSTSWCGVCKQMDRTVFADSSILGRLDNFVLVKVDGDARQDLCRIYDVKAYPTFIHLGPDMQILEKREGAMRTREMANALDRSWQKVSSSMMARQQQAQILQASAQNPVLQAPPQQQPDQNLVPQSAPAAQEPARQVADVPPAAEASSDVNSRPPAASLYNTDSQLQGSVYAMNAGPSSERRSRFGGGGGNGSAGLRELAVATAQPGEGEPAAEKAEEKSETKEVADSTVKKSESSAEKSRDDTKKEVSRASEPDKKNEDAAKAVSSSEDNKVAATVKKSDEEAVAKKSLEVADANLAPSPVIESRLSGLDNQALPKPLLSRTASTSANTEVMNPAPKVVSTVAKSDPLATIRRIQKDDLGVGTRPVSSKTQEISATDTKASDRADTSANSTDKSDKEQLATPVREVVSADAPSSKVTAAAAKAKEAESESVEKTSQGATREDIERWMKDADSKLVDQRKKEARAMYAKVVDKDPDNKFGKSDMAYVRMVSLIVDRDSDLLRRQAYKQIKEFEDRFPDSEHKDYYTLIRAILAADLGELEEAHKLLTSYSESFPDSKYTKMAEDTRKSLPPVSKSSSRKQNSASSSSNRSNRDS